MPSIDEEAKRWQMENAGRVGRAIQKRREALGWTAAELARRTADYGFPISRVAISKIESNSRLGKLDLSELMVLAAAMKTSPVTLVFPGPYMTLERGVHSTIVYVEALPGKQIASPRALEWFCAESFWQDPASPTDEPSDEDEWTEATRLSRTMRRITGLVGRKHHLLSQDGEPDREQLAYYDGEIKRLFTDLDRLQRKEDA